MAISLDKIKVKSKEDKVVVELDLEARILLQRGKQLEEGYLMHHMISIEIMGHMEE